MDTKVTGIDRHYYLSDTTDLKKIEAEATLYAKAGSVSVVHHHPYSQHSRCDDCPTFGERQA